MRQSVIRNRPQPPLCAHLKTVMLDVMRLCVIVSYRDKRTKDFAAGKWVKALSAIERSAACNLTV